jgi:hypothetical protein
VFRRSGGSEARLRCIALPAAAGAFIAIIASRDGIAASALEK